MPGRGILRKSGEDYQLVQCKNPLNLKVPVMASKEPDNASSGGSEDLAIEDIRSIVVPKIVSKMKKTFDLVKKPRRARKAQSFANFNIEAVTLALEETKCDEPVPDKLTCADYDKMKQGKTLSVLNIYDVTSKTFKKSPHGFSVPKRFREKLIGKWHHLLISYEKITDQNYKFINYSGYSKSVPSLDGKKSRSEMDVKCQVFFERKGHKRVQMNNEHVYVHVIYRHNTLWENKSFRIKEMVILSVYNDDSKKFLENRGFYQFVDKSDPTELSELFPHPSVHAPDCELATRK